MNLDTPDLHCVTRAEIESRQTGQFRQLLTELVPRNRFWAEKFAAAGLAPTDFRSLADLARFPFTTKAEILTDQKAHPPYGSNLTFDRATYSRLHQTSGTTGTPMRWLDTPASWQRLLLSWQQLFQLMGLRKDDRLFFAFSFGPFLGFWAGFEGANRLGNLCITAGGLSSQSRLNLLLENEATVVCCTPTYALRLAEVAADLKIDLRRSPVRAILVAGEPGGNIPATRLRIEDAWRARVIDHWGMTELGPLAIEPEGRPGGLAVLETECIAEIIDPASGQAVAAGEEGELVITNLGRAGSPLIRYRTGDRVRAESRPAAPGTPYSEFLYLPGGILGRTDDMLTIRGNNLYPSALEDAIRGFSDVAEFRIELRTVKAMQHIRIELEPAVNLNADAVSELAAN
ncbi:MAG TPA: AMP-binding protein, partial [Planctomycetaceae bacterium]|nr:AMP-binding protein [Planctomycetaceae bacterium]